MAPRLGGLQVSLHQFLTASDLFFSPIIFINSQKQALSLYRQVLRVAREKSSVEGRAGIEALARLEFEKNKSISRKDFNRIEHLLRVGKRRVEVIKDANVGGVSLQTPSKPSSS